MGSRRIAPFIVWFIAVFFTVSCSLFETREPEEPGTTTVPVFLQPNTPGKVIENLENAVRALNPDNYRRCLSEEMFAYEPSSIAQNSNPEIWRGWGFTEEEIYFNNMRAEAEGLSGHGLQFENASFASIRSDEEEQFEADYHLTIKHNRQGLPSEARGRIRMILVRDDDSGDWKIASWSDSTEGSDFRSDFTWSDFRAEFL